jgi:DNA-binding NarL/FixJ family response regulator
MTSGDSMVELSEGNGSGPTSARILVVIEDDPDVQFLIEAIFAMDPRFTITHVAKSAEEALDTPPTSEPGIIVLDHGLAGPLPGLAAAPLLKERAPQADREPAIDAFLLKTESEKLLPLAQQLIGLGPLPT